MPVIESFKGMSGNHLGRTFDLLLELTPQGTVAADDDVSAVVPIGTGLYDAVLVCDVAAGTPQIQVEFATDAAFTTPIEGITIILAVGRTIVPFRNLQQPMVDPAGYMRITYTAGGTLGVFIGKGD